MCPPLRSFARHCPPLRHSCTREADKTSIGRASISLEVPGVKLQVHHRAEHRLGEAAVKVTVEALYARDYEARRKIFSNIGIGAHAERATTIVRQSALAGKCQRVHDEVLSQTLLIAHSGSQI